MKIEKQLHYCVVVCFQVTDIGWRLLDFPVDHRLAKTILVSIGLQCLDPVVTIVSCLSRDDMFVLPFSRFERRTAFNMKYDLATCELSDHLAFLETYHLWQTASVKQQVVRL